MSTSGPTHLSVAGKKGVGGHNRQWSGFDGRLVGGEFAGWGLWHQQALDAFFDEINTRIGEERRIVDRCAYTKLHGNSPVSCRIW
jgi:hypothetical protein